MYKDKKILALITADLIELTPLIISNTLEVPTMFDFTVFMGF